MPKKERLDIPASAITFGEKIQGFGRIPPARFLINLFAGSSYEYWLPVRWRAVEEVIDDSDEEVKLRAAQADPDAGIEAFIPRLKKKAVVVSAGRLAMHDLLFDNDYAPVRPAVAYSYKGISHAGILPEGLLSLGNFPKDIYTAAFRSGRNDFGVGIGVWVPQERTFILPKSAKIEDQNIPLDNLHEEFPGAPLV